MARARTGGAGSGYAWALVIFGAGFVICLLLAIVFFAQLGGAREEATQASSELRQYISPNEVARPELAALDRQGRTVVGALLEENRSLKEIITGNPEEPTAAIVQGLEAANVDLALMRELQELRSTRDDLASRLQAAEQARDAQTQRAAQALQEREELARRYTESVQELQGEIAQLERDLADYQGAVAQLEQRLTSQFGQDRRQLAQQTADLENQLASRNLELDRLRQELDTLTDTGEGQVAKIAQADATVTGVVPGQNRIYLDRGSEDRVILGMTFEVFDDGDLVRLEQEGNRDARGKATVEVIDVRDDSAVARMVRSERGASVDENDQLINIVYDPNAEQNFYVYGDFDIDNRGESTVEDRQRIESLIRQWGGELAQQLSYDVDFLVLGQEPPLPEPLPPGVIDPVRIAENVEAQRNYETYQQLVGEARDLNIPILNQNRFLNLIGFYRR